MGVGGSQQHAHRLPDPHPPCSRPQTPGAWHQAHHPAHVQVCNARLVCARTSNKLRGTAREKPTRAHAGRMARRTCLLPLIGPLSSTAPTASCCTPTSMRGRCACACCRAHAASLAAAACLVPSLPAALWHPPTQISHMTSFSTSSFPDSLAVGKERGMVIGTIDDIQARAMTSHRPPPCCMRLARAACLLLPTSRSATTHSLVSHARRNCTCAACRCTSSRAASHIKRPRARWQ